MELLASSPGGVFMMTEGKITDEGDIDDILDLSSELSRPKDSSSSSSSSSYIYEFLARFTGLPSP